MQAVMISIQPKWCALIASGKKKVEVRKTAPKLETPFKCYIYQTKGAKENPIVTNDDGKTFNILELGKVIGEFVCDSIKRFDVPFPAYWDQVDKATLDAACLSYGEAHNYLGHRSGFAWRITGLKIYDKPKKLRDFERWENPGEDIRPCQSGKYCEHLVYDYSEDCQACAIDFDGTDCPFYKVTRPPQSWCYVEELHNAG